jgi:hypothetical protein
MRIKNKTPGLRIVGGTAYAPVGAETSSLSEPVFRRPEPPRDRAPPLTETSENARLREQRKQAWRMAETATRYWRVRMHFDHAVYMAQMMEMPEAAYHPVVDSKDLRLVERWREALVNQLLTPAPDLRSVALEKGGARQRRPQIYRREARTDRARDR